MTQLVDIACAFRSDLGTWVPPLSERGKIDALGAAKARRVDLWLAVMARVHAARNRKAAYATIAAQMEGSGLEGFSPANIKRTYLRFRASGWRWQALIPAYHNPDLEERAARSSLPAAFLAWWQRHAGSFAGGTRAAHADLVQRWRRGESIDGYGTWMQHYQERHPGRPLPASCPRHLPEGWSYDNLLDKLPTRAELTIVRDGFFRAMSELPVLPRDRAALRSFELVAFDDFQTDFRGTVPGIAQVVKLRGLAAMAVSCGVVVQHEIGASITDDQRIERTITRADMRALLFTFLRAYGLPVGYTMHLLVENATAAISDEDERFLQKISGGRIRVLRTAMHCRGLLAGGPCERLGSPQAKGWLESWFNLFHRAASALPAYAGSNPLTDKRGDIDAVEREALTVMRAAQGLPPDMLRMITTGVLTLDQAKTAVRDIVNRLNHREDHKLQGFELVPRWRLPGVERDNPWRAIAELPPHLRDVVEIEHFRETPMERFERLLRLEKFERIPEATLLPLLDDKVSVSVTRPYQITFQYRRVQRTYTLDDPHLEKVGTRFTACLDPRALESIYLLDEAGAYVGTAKLWQGPSPVDREQIAAAAAEAKRLQNRLIGRAQELHAARAQERVSELEQSNEQLAGAVAELETARIKLTPAEEAGAAQVRPRRSGKRKQQAVRSALADIAQQALNDSPVP